MKQLSRLLTSQTLHRSFIKQTSKQLAVIVSGLLFTASTFATTKTTTLVTESHTITGMQTEYGEKFLGIAYAEAPVNDKRWKPPVPKNLPDTVNATEFASGCPQTVSAFGTPSISEDCLYLNVYRPKESSQPRGFLNHWKKKSPVMIWIHGGAFTYGESHAFDPAPLVERGVVVVTINYRLGALGFMSHPALSAEQGSSGNYGFMDQQAALQWVQKNIHLFGGDKDSVTLFGESAGGLSVHAHLASPASAGLFKRAIIQSGAYALNQPSLQQWEALGGALAYAMGCPDQSLDCLRSLDTETILANQDPGDFGWLPIVDGQSLPQTIKQSLLNGQFNQVPVIQGTTANEYSLFTALYFDLVGNPVTEANYPQAIEAIGLPATVAPLLASYYPPQAYDAPGSALNALGTDFLFACNGLRSTQLLANYVKVYHYEFNDTDAPQFTLPPVSFAYGAYHGSEIQYLMATNERPFNTGMTQAQTDLAQDMVSYWTNFARFGNPNIGRERGPLWIRYGEHRSFTQSLQTGGSRLQRDFKQSHQCELWESLLGS